MATVILKCRDCKVEVQTIDNPDDDSPVSCSMCGVTDTYKNVMGSVADQVQYQSAKMLQDKMKGIASGSKLMSYSGTHIEKPSAQFTIDLNL